MDHDWRPEWRVALLPSYKAHRLAPEGGEVVPDTLTPQVPMILDVLDAVGITAVGAAGYEADDVLGTLVGHPAGPGGGGLRRPGPVPAHRRRPRGAAALLGRGVAKLEDCDDAAVRGPLRGAGRPVRRLRRAARRPERRAARGAGVGEKTAARLVDRYGGLDGILAALDDPDSGFAPGLRAKLAAARDYLAVAPKVVRVALDVPLPELPTALPTAPADPERLLDAGRAVEPRRLLPPARRRPGRPGLTPDWPAATHGGRRRPHR